MADIDFYFEVAGYEEEFHVVKFNGMENISQLFHYEIYVGSEDDDIPLEKLIGQPAMLIIGTESETRFISGMVSRFWWIGESKPYHAYFVELVPAIWLLTQRTDCRIFQNKTVPEIIEEVLKDAGIPSDLYDLKKLRGEHQPLEYCVQYDETDFDFISRLMEREGIFYFFEHHFENDKRRGKHVLVLGDDSSCHPAIGDKKKAQVKFHETSGQVPDEYRKGYQAECGAVMLRDFNYLHPDVRLEGKASARSDNMKYYAYPGGFSEDKKGDKLAQIRLQEMRTQHDMGSGRSNCNLLIPGFYFHMKDHPRKNYNQDYLLTTIVHAGLQRKADLDKKMEGLDKLVNLVLSHVPIPPIGPLSFLQIYSGLRKVIDALFGDNEEFAYSNQFTCIPLSTPFRAAPVTPRPIIHGPQTAIVVAPNNEIMHMDKLGRVRVKFHWDRAQCDDYKRTCDLRVAFNYAGSNHGFQFPPLAGDEVVVSFLEGDPDKPLITGAVYNGNNHPPLKPENSIENIILTPYQHRLLFSDKEKSITLNTGGKESHYESIEMIDGEPSTEYGRQIKITTADNHQVQLCKGSKVSGIHVETEQGQKLAMWDDPHPAGILIEDKDAAISLQLNSDQKVITIKNKSGPEIKIECSQGKVTVQGTGVDVAGGQVSINGSGAVEIKSNGKVKIEAPEIEASAAASFKVAAPNISLEGAAIDLKAGKINLQAALVQAVGLLMTQVLQSQTVISSSYTPGAGNIL
jgi:type VI secretion system secreted protein VgrG